MAGRLIAMRTRAVPPGTDSRPDVSYQTWDAARTAVVVCDMWDAHHCASAARRVQEMAPRVNTVLGALRAEGALVVHAPADCMDFYRDNPARTRAMRAPRVAAAARIDWHDWEPDELAALPASLTDPGACSCGTHEPCAERARVWTRQSPLIDVAPGDAVSDDGQELFNMMEERGIADVLVLGVHTNLCVLGRPYGIRQLVALGKRPVLCRDLTDAFHRDPHGHHWGTAQVVAHIEHRWCPTVTSDQLVGGVPFSFSGGT